MIKLRVATIDDAQFLFDLRNEKSNRAMFRDTNEVLWEDHIKWLSGKLLKGDFFIYIAIDDKDMIGQFRIDEKGEVSVSLSEKFKGKGVGWQIIKAGSEMFRKHSQKVLIADVKTENISSLKSFQKAGYQFKETYKIEDQEYKRLIF